MVKRYELKEGIAPSLQLKAKKAELPDRKIGYIAHCGAKQRKKELARQAKAEAKIQSRADVLGEFDV